MYYFVISERLRLLYCGCLRSIVLGWLRLLYGECLRFLNGKCLRPWNMALYFESLLGEEWVALLYVVPLLLELLDFICQKLICQVGLWLSVPEVFSIDCALAQIKVDFGAIGTFLCLSIILGVKQILSVLHWILAVRVKQVLLAISLEILLR